MHLLVQILIFIAAGTVIWYFSGVLIQAVDKFSRKLNKSGFVVGFFILGFLTSIGEISVATNSLIDGVPQVSIGNLVGASFVILLLIMPMLAIVGDGIKLNGALTGRNLFIALLVILLPALLVIDGNVTVVEGVVALLAYVVLLFAIRNQKQAEVELPKMHADLSTGAIVFAVLQMILGTVSIFIAGNILVDQSIYFAELLGISPSLVGLLLLSIGTNVPEIVIALRAVVQKQQGIAFGGYLGSTATNTVTFAVVALMGGPFLLQSTNFFLTSILLLIGFVLFFVFARSRDTITRREGYVLLLVYILFVCVQAITAAGVVFF